MNARKSWGFVVFFLKYAKFLYLNISLAPLPFSNNLINEFVIEGENGWMVLNNHQKMPDLDPILDEMF